MLPYTLGPEYRDYTAFGPRYIFKGEAYMRINEDLRKTVVFLGFENGSDIRCIGTGFLVHYKEVGYLVTARHVAMDLNGVPFVIRVNWRDGSAKNIPEDNIQWNYHPDDNIDIAVIPYDDKISNRSIYDTLFIPLPDLMKSSLGEYIDVGDNTYTIGLFRLVKGKKRNLPVVHSGNIALLPREERIPVKDWYKSISRKTRYVDAYLVETQSLDGLSGAPVFARPTINYPLELVDPMARTTYNGRAKARESLGTPIHTAIGSESVYLIGLWHGAWNEPPDEILAAEIEKGERVRVSLGMGIVIPATYLIELLETPKMQEERDEIVYEKIHPASQDKVEIESAIENPQHKEDFNSLVSAAAKKKPPDNKT